MKLASSRGALTVIVLAATASASLLLSARAPEQLTRPLGEIPVAIADWSGGDNPPLDDQTVSVLRATSYLSRTYTDGATNQSLDFFVAYYAHQEAGETMHSPKNCLPGSGWEVWTSGEVEISVEGRPTAVNQYAIRKGPERMNVLYWYQSGDRVVASEYEAKLCLIYDSVIKQRTSGAIVRVVFSDDRDSLRRAVKFAETLIPYVRSCLPGANGSGVDEAFNTSGGTGLR